MFAIKLILFSVFNKKTNFGWRIKFLINSKVQAILPNTSIDLFEIMCNFNPGKMNNKKPENLEVSNSTLSPGNQFENEPGTENSNTQEHNTDQIRIEDILDYVFSPTGLKLFYYYQQQYQQ